MSNRKPRHLAPIGRWIYSTYMMASMNGISESCGLVYAGLAITKLWDASPKGRRPPRWNVTHIGTGHRVCMIDAHQAAAFAIADAIADLGDWTFDGITGWRNSDPNLIDRLMALASAHPSIVLGSGGNADDAVAREVAMARA